MSSLHLANTLCLKQAACADVKGEYVTIDGESWYKITNYSSMQPFFMSIVSASNFWLFVSSNGGLTCGRVSADFPIFPYYTVDKIHDEQNTGPKTGIHVEKGGKTYLWEPFVFHPSVYKTTRNLYKNMLGNMLTFEEVNHDLGLTFAYTWAMADKYGIVRKCKLVNHSGAQVNVRVLDGMQNIIAANTNGWLQDCMSNLLEAYKWNELVAEDVAVFCLFAKLSDRAEPLESLKATTVWQAGLPDAEILLSSTQLSGFLCGESVAAERLVRGKRASFLAHSGFTLADKAEQRWLMVTEVEQTHDSISKLQASLAAERAALPSLVDQDIAAGSLALKHIMGAADGFQCLEDAATSTHHYANVMFNTMRGGIYDKGYIIDRADLISFIKQRNVETAKKYEAWLSSFPESINYLELLGKSKKDGDADLVRLCFEYVPITFSRRHGDPSRPWNKFSIQLKDDQGHKLLNYQGNWRDIFQNWEALTVSFPYFFESIIAKFVNASTVDGYNPYVVTKAEGINWECPEPDHPHANIGYWGDHQIIYLLKLLEWCTKFQPGKLEENCQKDAYSYANVPYEIRAYEKVVEDAKDTITFDWAKHKRIDELKKTMGVDAKLLLDKAGHVMHVNLAEKLLVPLLAKASNFVVEGGIWLNTQRPEWNDANNAIVGFGLSMVTVYYMRRYVHFLIALFKNLGTTAVSISEEVATWLTGLGDVFQKNVALLGSKLSAADRRKVLDALGGVASAYRAKVYAGGLSGARTPVGPPAVIAFLETLQKYIDHSISANLKPDGLYHAYNLLILGPGTADVSHLYEMLEGQVSALSSGLITANAASAMLKSMFASGLYRADQHSFMLYPDRTLKGFMERNLIPADKKALPAVKFCLDHNLKDILYEDASKDLRFASGLSNANDLKAAISAGHAGLKDHTQALLDLYELVFNHRAFTGRSGTMFGFEGLGCIYWHMVSKLLLASQELTWDALDKNDPSLADLLKQYYDVRAGLGFNKSPDVYGAFPCDPYSHTPKHAGAQQPGMTGQVKEEVLTRFGELGARIANGTIKIQPRLLRRSEFLLAPRPFEYVPLSGELTQVQLQKDQLGFTYCQCLFVYTKGKQLKVVAHVKGKAVAVDGGELPAEVAGLIFQRSGDVTRVDVEIPEADLV